MAGDYMASNGFIKYNVTQAKIFTRDGLTIGYSGTFRIGQILEAAIEKRTLFLPKSKDHLYKWLITEFIDFVRTEVRAGLGSTEFDRACVAGNVLFALTMFGEVWEVQGDFSVVTSCDGVVSVGSGCYHAVSSVLTQIKMLGRQPTIVEAEKMLEVAYDVTSRCVTSVSREYNTIATYNEGITPLKEKKRTSKQKQT